jgi:hypothetical protein
VQQTLLEVNKTDMKVDGDGRSWAKVDGDSGAIMKVEEAQKRAAAEIALKETPEERRLREERRREKAERETKIAKWEEDTSGNKFSAMALAEVQAVIAKVEEDTSDNKLSAKTLVLGPPQSSELRPLIGDKSAQAGGKAAAWRCFATNSCCCSLACFEIFSALHSIQRWQCTTLRHRTQRP